MALALLNPVPTFQDLDGSPLDDGYLYFGLVNNNPLLVPGVVYWDAAATIPAAQPIRTLNGYPYRNGSPAIIYTSGDVSLLVQNKNKKQVLYAANSADWGNAAYLQTLISEITTDLADTSSPSAGASLIGWLRAATASVSTTLKAFLGWQEINLFEFMTVAQIADYQSTAMTLDLTAPIQAWLTACAGGRGRLPKGFGKFTTPLVIGTGTTINGSGGLSRLCAFGCNAIRVTGDFVSLRDFHVYMFSALGSADPRTNDGIIVEGSNGDARSNIDIDTVYVRGAVNSIDWRYAINSKITNVDTIFSTTGVRLFGACLNNTIADSRLLSTGTGSASISLVSDAGLTIRGEGLMISGTLLASGVNAVKSDAAGFLSLGIDTSCVIDLISGKAFDLFNVQGLKCDAQWVYSADTCFNFNNLGASTEIDADINVGKMTCTGGAGIPAFRWGTNNVGLMLRAKINCTNAAGNYPLVIVGTKVDAVVNITQANTGVAAALVTSAGNRVVNFGSQTIEWNATRIASVASNAGGIVLPHNNCNTFIITGTAAIPSIVVDGWDGEEVTLIFASTASLVAGSNLKIGVTFSATADDVIKLVCSGANWYRVAAGAVN